MTAPPRVGGGRELILALRESKRAAAQFLEEAAASRVSLVNKAARNLLPDPDGARARATVEIAVAETGGRARTPG